MPIADVNFLVGENSTGKTSVLGLLRLISSPEFWFNPSFDVEDPKFGHFHDIVSVHTDDQTYFRIGFIRDGEEPKGEKRQSNKTLQGPAAFLATFKEQEGLPLLSCFTYIDQDSQHAVKFTKSAVFSKTEPFSTSETADSIRTKLFDTWVREQGSGRAGYRKLPVATYALADSRMLLFLTMAVLQRPPTANKSEPKRSERSITLVDPLRIPSVVWTAPIRTQPRRTYDEVRLDFSPDGTHIPYVIRKILDSKREAERFLSFMRNVGKSSGLFESIRIKRHGRGKTAPFEVDIVLDKKALNLSTVGYGVSQSLPVIVELFVRSEGTWFAIQQPEVHLHPRAQAALGDVFFDLAVRENKCFFVETHSDYTIDRFRMNFGRRQRGQPNSQILFFERKNSRNVVSALPIGSKGELPRKQPDSYRRFFLKEQLRSLGI